MGMTQRRGRERREKSNVLPLCMPVCAHRMQAHHPPTHTAYICVRCRISIFQLCNTANAAEKDAHACTIAKASCTHISLCWHVSESTCSHRESAGRRLKAKQESRANMSKSKHTIYLLSPSREFFLDIRCNIVQASVLHCSVLRVQSKHE